MFDAIAASATRLCGGLYGAVYRRYADVVDCVALYNMTPDAENLFRRAFPRPVTAGMSPQFRRAVVDGAVVVTPDIETDSDLPPRSRDFFRSHDTRSVVLVPLLRRGEVIGVLGIGHGATDAFSDDHVKLLKTFADQAVIAIENVRLFKELEARNAELSVALEQQTATGEILRVIAGAQTEPQPVFDTIAASALSLCQATFSVVLRLDGETLHLAAMDADSRTSEALRQIFPMPLGRSATTARAVRTREVAYVRDAAKDPEYALRDWAQAVGFRSSLSVPMLRDGVPIGAINVSGVEPEMFSAQQVELLRTFADQAVIAIENARLFKELEARNTDLSTALEQQTATAEILRVIAGSHTDPQPVFDAIAASALALCRATFSAVIRFDGELLHLVAQQNTDLQSSDAVRQAFPMPSSASGAAARSVRTCEVVYLADVWEDPEYGFRDLAHTAGYRSMLVRADAAGWEPDRHDCGDWR